MTTMYTIYENPMDYPGRFVVREFVIDGPTPKPGRVCAITKRIGVARASIPPDAVRIPRDPSDPSQIVESWI